MARKKKLFKIKLKDKNTLLTLGLGLVIIISLMLVFLSAKEVLIIVSTISGLIVLYELSKKWTKKKKKKSKTKSSSKKKSTKKTKKKKKKRKIWKIIISIILFIGILCVIGAAIFIMYIVNNAPEFNPDELYNTEATEVYSSEGTLIAKLGREKRENITYDDLPQVFIDALVATEDSRFFQHNGFDLPRFIKASAGQLMGNSGAGGASTLTMQVSKNTFTSTNQTIIRKFTDIYMAIWVIEQNYTKEEIFEFYVNSPYLGAGAYGIEQACQNFFGKSATDINLAEAALMAGVFQAPGAQDPFLHPEAAETRRQTVLSLMERHGYITAEERAAASAITIADMLTNKTDEELEYQGYVDTVVEEVLAKTGLNPYDTAMIINTNMVIEKQKHVDKVLSGDGDFDFRDDKVQAGFVVTDVKTGKVVAIGAGRNREGERSFNYATMIKRQAGSTAKPLFDYGPAFEYNNWSTYHPLLDEEYSYSDGSSISNWDGKYMGLLTLRDAFKDSRNIPALKTFQANNNKKIIEFVTDLGITPEISKYGGIHEAHAIGGFNGTNPYEMSGAYAAFANGGYYTEPYTVSKITYKDTGEKVVYNPEKERVMKDSTADMVTKCITMSTYANGKNIRMAAKTGTTNLASDVEKQHGLPSDTVSDAWVIGYTPNYSMAMWYGYDEISKDNYLTTKSAWSGRKKLFIALSTGITEVDGSKFPTSKNVISVSVERETWPAALPSENTPKDMKVTEYFIKGTQPTQTSSRFKDLNDITNLTSTSVGGNVISLSWDYTPPTYLSDSYLNSYYLNLYGDYKDKYLAQREDYDNANMGDIVFKIYRLNSDESVTYLGETTNTEYDYTFTSLDNVTFIVKTSYEIFTAAASEGAYLTVNPTDVEIINMTLNGSSNIELFTGASYVEPTPSVNVFNNLTDVTSESITTSTIVRQSDSAIVGSIDTSVPEVFTITYETTYESTTETNTRTITVTEEISE